MPRRCDLEIKCEGLLVQVQVELSAGDTLQQRIQSGTFLCCHTVSILRIGRASSNERGSGSETDCSTPIPSQEMMTA
jgi:hypothetical protein